MSNSQTSELIANKSKEQRRMSDIYSGITVSEADRGVTLETEGRRYSTGVRRMSDIVGTSSIRAGVATMMPNE